MNKKYEYNGNIYCEDDLSEIDVNLMVVIN